MKPAKRKRDLSIKLSCVRRLALRNSWLTWPRSSNTKSSTPNHSVHSSVRVSSCVLRKKGSGIDKSRMSLLNSAMR